MNPDEINKDLQITKNYEKHCFYDYNCHFNHYFQILLTNQKEECQHLHLV